MATGAKATLHGKTQNDHDSSEKRLYDAWTTPETLRFARHLAESYGLEDLQWLYTEGLRKASLPEYCTVIFATTELIINEDALAWLRDCAEDGIDCPGDLERLAKETGHAPYRRYHESILGELFKKLVVMAWIDVHEGVQAYPRFVLPWCELAYAILVERLTAQLDGPKSNTTGVSQCDTSH